MKPSVPGASAAANADICSNCFSSEPLRLYLLQPAAVGLGVERVGLRLELSR